MVLGRIFSVFVLGILSCHLAIASPRVVVSIMPIHSLVSQLMDGVGTPSLLLPPDHSPHHFQLKPSDAENLEKADLVFWIGPELENFLTKPIEALSSQAKITTLIEVKGLPLLTMRHHHHHDDEEHSPHSLKDPHLWLDPQNILKLIPEMTQALVKVDPEHASQYNTNAQQLILRIKQLDQDLEQQLTQVKDAAFLVYHDGYEYLIKRYQLNGLGPITDHPHVPLSLHKIKKIRRKIVADQAVCVFSEPEINPNIMAQLISDSPVRQGILDPLGFELKPGPSAYELMMRDLGLNIYECLRTH